MKIFIQNVCSSLKKLFRLQLLITMLTSVCFLCWFKTHTHTRTHTHTKLLSHHLTSTNTLLLCTHLHNSHSLIQAALCCCNTFAFFHDYYFAFSVFHSTASLFSVVICIPWHKKISSWATVNAYMWQSFSCRALLSSLRRTSSTWWSGSHLQCGAIMHIVSARVTVSIYK